MRAGTTIQRVKKLYFKIFKTSNLATYRREAQRIGAMMRAEDPEWWVRLADTELENPDPAAFERTLPQLRGSTILPGCGHWTQQERPDEVNSLLTDFLRSL